jgi:hypothetical protein
VVEGEIADERVEEAFGAGGVSDDVVIGPHTAEGVAVEGRLPDQLGELRVVGVTSGVEAQHGQAVAGDPFRARTRWRARTVACSAAWAPVGHPAGTTGARGTTASHRATVSASEPARRSGLR